MRRGALLCRRRRAAPRAVGALPVQLAALNRTFLNVVELTVQAALTGHRDYVYQAALLDPNTAATLTTAETVAMCDELLDAHAAMLPSPLADNRAPGKSIPQREADRPCPPEHCVLQRRSPRLLRRRPDRRTCRYGGGHRPADRRESDSTAAALRCVAGRRSSPGRRRGQSHRPALATGPATKGDRLLSFGVAFYWKICEGFCQSGSDSTATPFAASKYIVGHADTGRKLQLTETATEVVQTRRAPFSFSVANASATVKTRRVVRAYPSGRAPRTEFTGGLPEHRTGSRQEYFEVGPPHYATSLGKPVEFYRIDHRSWHKIRRRCFRSVVFLQRKTNPRGASGHR